MTRPSERGSTLTELVMGVAVLGIATLGIAGLVKYTGKALTGARTVGVAQEETRQALMLLEDALIHANEVRIASATTVEFVLDIEHAAAYQREGDPDADGIPNWRDGDRDADVNLLLAAANQWQGGFNLDDDDEDGDAQVDLMGRVRYANRQLLYETRTNGGNWTGTRTLLNDVSTFTITYWGSKANSLGSAIDLGVDGNSGTGDSGENDGVITSREMDWVQAPAGMGNRSGGLDLANERRYITSFRVSLGVDKNRDGKNDYAIDTDVYPPLLPLKSR